MKWVATAAALAPNSSASDIAMSAAAERCPGTARWGVVLVHRDGAWAGQADDGGDGGAPAAARRQRGEAARARERAVVDETPDDDGGVWGGAANWDSPDELEVHVRVAPGRGVDDAADGDDGDDGDAFAEATNHDDDDDDDDTSRAAPHDGGEMSLSVDAWRALPIDPVATIGPGCSTGVKAVSSAAARLELNSRAVVG